MMQPEQRFDTGNATRSNSGLSVPARLVTNRPGGYEGISKTRKRLWKVDHRELLIKKE